MNQDLEYLSSKIAEDITAIEVALVRSIETADTLTETVSAQPSLLASTSGTIDAISRNVNAAQLSLTLIREKVENFFDEYNRKETEDNALSANN